MKLLLLVASTIITVGSVIPYARNIIRGTTRPNIVSWITWTLLTLVATVAEFAAGEITAGVFTSAAALETLVVVILGLKYGYVKYTRFDVICQLGALAGFMLWALFNSPALAVIAAVTIDFIGALPTIRHSWLKPGEETWPTYAICAGGGILAILALDAFNWTSLTYALYIVAINIFLSCLLIARGRFLTVELNAK